MQAAGHPVLLAVTLIAEVFVPTIVLIRVFGQQAKRTIINIFIESINIQINSK